MRAAAWSLRTWIFFPTAVVVTLLVAGGAVLQTDTLVQAWLSSTRQIAQLSGRQASDFVLSRVKGSPAGALIDHIRSDQAIAEQLESTVAGGSSVVELAIVDSSGTVLASSNRARPKNAAAVAPALASLSGMGIIERLRELWKPAREYEYRIPIGVAGDARPLFTVQVLVSNALLRESLRPGMDRIVWSAGVAYLVALVLAWFAGEFTRANLNRIGAMIDSIGGPAATPVRRPAAAEFAAVQSKLSLMEDRVRTYRRRIDALLEKLEEAVLVVDGDRVVLAAGPTQSLLGLEPGWVTGRSLREIFGPSSGFFELLAAGHSIHNAPAAAARNLLVSLDYISESSAVIRLRDAEGASELQSQFEISSRLEAINRLTGGVAHEIKNPLNAIAARLGLLEAIVEGNTEAEQEIQTIASEIERLDRVVRTFLDFTQPLDIVREDINLVVLTAQVADFVRPDAERRSISVTVQTSNPEVWVRGDEGLLKQALMNLAVNAVEAMSQGGRLTFDIAANNTTARVAVTDTGPGIPDAVRPKIFRLYFTTKPNGSGIGLAVAYRTMQLHGGDLQVESVHGTGTTFLVTLPIAHKEVTAAA